MGVAMRRAMHQLVDVPCVFRDPLALRMAGLESGMGIPSGRERSDQTPLESRLRAFLAARSRYAEDLLHHVVPKGVRQYVLLGAGLDTFPYRNPYPEDLLHVFEVDHPSTQAWKRTRLREAGIPIPRGLTFAPIDFETESLGEALGRTGFDAGTRTFFSWLGVTVYVSVGAVTSTLQFVASMPAGSGIALDYMISPNLLDPTARRVFDGLAERVSSAGEPFRTFLDPSLLRDSLREKGFGRIEDLGPEELNHRYFRGRGDGLRVGSLSHVLYAEV